MRAEAETESQKSKLLKQWEENAHNTIRDKMASEINKAKDEAKQTIADVNQQVKKNSERSQELEKQDRKYITEREQLG